jgi:hypothetical protein
MGSLDLANYHQRGACRTQVNFYSQPEECASATNSSLGLTVGQCQPLENSSVVARCTCSNADTAGSLYSLVNFRDKECTDVLYETYLPTNRCIDEDNGRTSVRYTVEDPQAACELANKVHFSRYPQLGCQGIPSEMGDILVGRCLPPGANIPDVPSIAIVCACKEVRIQRGRKKLQRAPHPSPVRCGWWIDPCSEQLPHPGLRRG